MTRACAVCECYNRSNREKDKKFFGFPGVRDNRGRDVPQGIERRALWVKALRRADLTAEKLRYATVCSDHFLTGKPSEDKTHPDYVPSQKLGYVSADVVGAEAQERHAKTKKRVMEECTPEEPEIRLKPEVDEGASQAKANELAKTVSEKQSSKESKPIVLNLLPGNCTKSSKVSNSLQELLSEDKTSIQGQFGWTQFDDICIPYLIRSEEKYVSVDMIQSKIFCKYTKYFSTELYSCGLLEKFHMSTVEAKLLNEINSMHCDNYFGNKLYTTADYIIKLTYVNEMHEFLNFCYDKLIKKDISIHKRCGFIDIADSCVPYVWFNNKQCVPIFYFDGQCKYLDEQAEQLKGFDLSYLKLLCKIQGLKKIFFDVGSIPVVDIEFVKKLFTPDTIFRECWPTEYCIKSLLNSSVVDDDSDALNKNNQENIGMQTVDQVLQQNQIVGQPSQQNIQIEQLQQNQQPMSQLPQILNLQPTEQLQQKQILQPTRQLQLKYVSSQKFKKKTTRYINSATSKPYPTKSNKPTENGVSSQNAQANKHSETGTIEVRLMPNPNVTVLNGNLGKSQSSAKPIFVQIPDYAPSKNVYYFLVRSQIEDKFLQHCTNIDPFRKNVIIVTLEEVSEVFKIPLNTLLQIISDLCINVYLPNQEQLRLLSTFKRYLTSGLIVVQDLMDHLPKIRSISRDIMHKSS